MTTSSRVGPLLLVLLAAAWMLAVAPPASAQVELGGYRLEGDVWAGWRFFIDEPPKSRRTKWEEYRDFPGSAFLDELQLRIFRPDEKYSASFYGSKWGQQDQEFSLRSERLGLWEFGFDWDQTPHVFSTNARFLATESSRGVFTLADPRPPLAAHNSAPTLDEVSVRWDTAKVFLKLTPTPDLDIKAEYMRIRKDGDRPFAMAFGSPGGNFYEILEPIEQTIHDFRIKGTWAKENWQLQFGYTLSIFQNDLQAVKADNPCFGPSVAPAGCGSPSTTVAATGQVSLPPDNVAHSFTLGGGINLPMRTRINGNFSYTLMLQNDDFLPHTINPVLANNKDLILPQSSLNGTVHTYLLNLSATSRPLNPLTLTAKYRLFALDDASDQITFPGTVVNDQASLGESRRAHRHEFLRQNASLDGRWQFAWPVALTLGGGWEQWRRNEVGEVPVSNEYSGKAALDVTPWDWLSLRASYVPSWRRINEYNTGAHAAHTVFEDPSEPPVTTGQSLLLRKFHEADFNRNKAELMLTLTPLDTLTITPTATYMNTDYSDSPLGMQTTDSWSLGVDVTWSPFERVSFSAGYVHDVNFNKMRSRSRPVSNDQALDFADFDWISAMTDTFDTVYAGVKAWIIPNVLDWRLNASYAYALGTVENRNQTAPLSGSSSNNFSAQAKRMPAFDDELIHIDTGLTYYFLKNWRARFSYVFESFTKHDWRTDGLNPFTPALGNSILMGNDLRNYTAHMLLVTIGYVIK